MKREKEIRTCPICGVEFEAGGTRRKYCSPECSREAAWRLRCRRRGKPVRAGKRSSPLAAQSPGAAQAQSAAAAQAQAGGEPVRSSTLAAFYEELGIELGKTPAKPEPGPLLRLEPDEAAGWVWHVCRRLGLRQLGKPCGKYPSCYLCPLCPAADARRFAMKFKPPSMGLEDI